MSRITRRKFLQSSAATAAAVATVGPSAIEASVRLPDPVRSGIDHVVVLMMENRSFDHYLGWMPGADGRQAGLTYVDRAGRSHDTYRLRSYKGCGHPDPDHSYEGGREQLNGGACDGFLRSGANDRYAIGYYKRPDLPFLGEAALRWTTFDRYFTAIMGPTYPNRFYQHSGVADRIENTTDISTLPTIWDRLADAGLTGRYYYHDLPFLALWGAKYLPISRSYTQFLADCAAGTLPNVSFVDPRFGGAEEGLSADDHPFADIRVGQSFMYRTYKAITESPAWPRTVFVINYDEWGGFFDHVAPSLAPDVDPSLRLRGFRVPALLVSPFARRGHVSHRVFDHTSILRMIEWRWGLAPLSVRDGSAANLASVMDFSRRRLFAPSFDVPIRETTEPCPSDGLSEHGAESEAWRATASAHGWRVQ